MTPTIAYFGYGSLVNLETLQTPYISAHRARLSGWKRTWLKRPKVPGSFAPIDGLAFLSVEPCPHTQIEGIVIVDHHTSLDALDRREALYNRHALDHACIEFLDDNPLAKNDGLFLYAAQEPPAGRDARILRSYLDVVMRGYHGHFGEQGVQRFISTTENFDCPIHEDRHKPVYPRSVSLQDHEAELFDRHLDR